MNRPEIILAPGPTPIPPEVLARAGEPARVPPRPRVRPPDARGDGPAPRALPDRTRRHPADDVVGDRRPRVRASRTCCRPATRCSSRSPGSSRSAGRSSPRPTGSWSGRSSTSGARRIDPATVAAALAEHPVKAVLLTQSETSTGVIQPVEELARVAREAGALVVVDCVSSLGAVPFEFDDWGHRRRGRRVAEGAERVAGHRVRRDLARARGRRTRPRRCRASTSTGASTSGSPTCPIPRTRGRPRSA